MSSFTPAAGPAAATGVTVSPVDITSDADLEAVNRINAAQEEHAYGGSTAPTVSQTRADCADTKFWRQHRLLAELEVGGRREVVGTGWLGLPLAECVGVGAGHDSAGHARKKAILARVQARHPGITTPRDARESIRVLLAEVEAMDTGEAVKL